MPTTNSTRKTRTRDDDHTSDDAHIAQLAARVFAGLHNAFTQHQPFTFNYSPQPGDHIYTALLAEQGLTFLLPGCDCPHDPVAAILADWPAPIVTSVALP